MQGGAEVSERTPSLWDDAQVNERTLPGQCLVGQWDPFLVG